MKISRILRTAIAVLKKPVSLIPLVVVIASMLIATFAYRTLIQTQAYVPTPLTAPIPTLPPLPTATPTTVSSQTGTSIVLPPQDPTQILFTPYPQSAYAVVNARIGYKFLDDKVHVGLIGTNLGPVHSEHPFGNRISQRFFATLSVTP